MSIKKETTTIRDIAKIANVSYQTVSLVMNGKPGVSEATRKRILQLMDEMEYRPNRAAQILTTQRSNILELVIVDVIYGGRLADSTKNMAHAARGRGYSLLVAETDFKGLPETLETAAAQMVDGFVLYAPRLRIADETLQEICKGIPLVRRDFVPGSHIPWVGFDQVSATRLATEHLIQLGHRQIAAIPPSHQLINGQWRFSTWKNVLHEHGLEPGPAFEGDYSMSSGYLATQQILATGEPFTALLAGTDNMAIGAMRALREAGLRVPDDVSVIGFDNTEMAEYIDPPLTTVDFKFIKQDEMVVDYLIDIISNRELELHHRMLMSDLIIRGSTRQI
jgi:DNA-binding LacI/PurR family transcriptional regulator